MANGKIEIDVLLNSNEAEKGLQDVEKQSGGLNKAFGAVGVAAAAAAAAIVAIGTQAVASFLEAEQATVRLQNQLGLSAEGAENLTNIAKNIYNQGFGESLNEVTDALSQVRQNIGDLNDEDLQRVTNQALGLAQTFDADINEVTRAAGNIAKAYGIEASEAFDLLANGAQNGLNFSNELFDNVSEYIPLFEQYGFSAQEAFGFLQNGAQQGVYNLDYINDIVKEFGIRANDASTTTADAFARLGGNASLAFDQFQRGEISVAELSRITGEELAKIDNSLVQNSIGVDLYGTKFEDLGADVAIGLFTGSEAVSNYAGTTDEILTNLEQTTQQRFDGLVRTITGFLVPIGGIIVEVLDNALTGVINTFNRYSGSILSAATSTYDRISPYIDNILTTIRNFIDNNLQSITGFWERNGERITNIVQTAFSAILLVIQTVLPIALGVITFIWNSIVMIIEGAIAIIDGVINAFTALIQGNFSAFWEAILQIFTGGIQFVLGLLNLSFVGGIRNLLANFATASLTTIRGLWTNISGSFTSSIATITGSFRTFVTNLINYFKGLGDDLVTTVKTFGVNVVSGFRKIADDAINIFASLPGRFVQFGKDIINGLLDGIRSIDVFATIGNIADGLVNTVKDKLSIFSPSRVFAGIGEDINAGWEIGLTNNSGDVLRAVSDTTDGILTNAISATSALSNGFNNLSPNLGGLLSGSLSNVNAIPSSNNNNSKTQINNVTVQTNNDKQEYERQMRRLSFGF